jgi:hypothetical protein
MRLGLACTALTISHFATAQLVVDPSLTAQQVVTEILVGEGVQVSNITFSGDLDQIGSFDAANSNILIPNGLIMASGTCNLAVGPNNSGSLTLGSSSISFPPGTPFASTIPSARRSTTSMSAAR